VHASVLCYVHMALVIVGLGNPGKEYEKTRHNAGRMAVELLARDEEVEAFAFNKTAHALVAKGAVDGEKAVLVLPETFVNLSGKAVAAFVKTPAAAKDLLVIHDDLDLPIGSLKMVFGRGSGGHKGVESVMRSLKTKEFARLRIGVAPVGKKNQAKKLKDEEKVIKHVIGTFSPSEALALKKVLKKTVAAARLFASDGYDAATLLANTR